MQGQARVQGEQEAGSQGGQAVQGNAETEVQVKPQTFKFGQVIPAAEAGRVVSEIRAGDERSKNKGEGRAPENYIKEPLVVSTVPLSEFETPDQDYGTYLKFLEATTDQRE